MADLNVALILRLIDQATGPARAAIANVQAAGAQVQRFGEAQIAAGRAMQETAAARTAALQGQTLAAVGASFALYGLMRPAVQFESAMARVGAVSRATAEEQELLTRTARELGAATTFSASEAADGMGFLAMAGFNVNQTVAAMPGLLNLAAASGADLGRTSDIASNILSAFRLEAGEMGRVGDVLVNTFTSSNTTLEMLGATFRYAAPIASGLGMDLETVAAAAGLLGNLGIQGEEGGTALRAILMRLTAPSTEAAAALERLNLQISDEHGNLRDMPTILAEMDQAMQGLGDVARAELLNAIFGMEAAGAAAVLMASAGSGEFQRYTETLRETGSAARVAEQMNDTARGSLRRLASAAEEAQIALGNGLLPVLQDVVDRVLPMVVVAGQWIEANQELVTTIGFVAAGVIGLNVAVLAAQWGFWLLFGQIGKLRVGIGYLIMSLGILKMLFAVAAAWGLAGLTIAFGKLAGVFTAVGGALALIKAPVWIGIGVAVAAFATAALLVWKYWDRITAVLSGVARALQELLAPALDWAAERWSEVTAYLSGVVHDFAEDLGIDGDAVVAAFARMLDLRAHFARLAEAFNNARALVSDWATWLGSFFTREVLSDEQRAAAEQAGYDFVMRIAAALASGASALYDAGAAMIQSLWDGAVARFLGFIDWVRSIPAQIVAAIGSIDLSGVIRWPGSGAGPRGDSRSEFWDRMIEQHGSRAIGGPVRQGMAYQVGEEGTELFVPDQPGRIVRHQDLARIVSNPPDRPVAAGGDTNIFHIHAAPGMTEAEVARQIVSVLEERDRRRRFALHDGPLL